MDPEQQDEQFFQMLESAYNTIIENHTHPEESKETPPDFDCERSDVQTLLLDFPLDLPDLPPFSEHATAHTEPCTKVLNLREIVSESLQLSQKAMGLAMNTAIYKASVGCPRSPSSGSYAHEEEGPSANDQIININHGKDNNDGDGDGDDDGDGTGAGAGAGASAGIATAMAAAVGDAPTEDPSAVDLEFVSRLVANSYTDRYADVELMLGCYQLIGKIAKEMGDNAIEAKGD